MKIFRCLLLLFSEILKQTEAPQGFCKIFHYFKQKQSHELVSVSFDLCDTMMNPSISKTFFSLSESVDIQYIYLNVSY